MLNYILIRNDIRIIYITMLFHLIIKLLYYTTINYLSHFLDECNFVVNPLNKREFKPTDTARATYTQYQTCADNTHFALEECTCMVDDDGKLFYCMVLFTKV